VGSWAIVAEGAVVSSGQLVDDETIVAGVPAKVVGRVTLKHKDFWVWLKKFMRTLLVITKGAG